MESSPVSRPALLVAAFLVLLSGRGLAAEEAPIELPTYTVTTGRELPLPEQWSYARIDGFEVLSGLPEAKTRQLLKDFQRFSYSLNLLWPGLRPGGAANTSLIICGERGKFLEFLPDDQRKSGDTTVSFHVRGREQAAIVADFQTKIINLDKIQDLPDAPAASPAADAESTGESEAPLIPGFAIDSYQQLYREYLRFLLTARPVPQPAWLTEGLSQLFMNMRIAESEITVGRVEDPNLVPGRGGPGAVEDRDFNAALAKRALLPMAELFAVTGDSAAARNPPNTIWAKQSYAFVHWGLYGDFGRNKKAFATFVARLEREPLSESLFKECFKQDYRQMLQALRNHIESTRTQFDGVRAEKGQKIPFPADAVVRTATQAEVGRLTGDVLSLTGHPAEARNALVTAYWRGERDPALLAALGQAEASGGDLAKARKFLEVAAAARVVRPRAHVELARLRLAEAQAKPEAPGGKLSDAQAAHVLEPLRLARSQPPALPETYELLGTIWSASATPPSAAQLGLLKEGLRLFPNDEGLRARLEKLTADLPAAPATR